MLSKLLALLRGWLRPKCDLDAASREHLKALTLLARVDLTMLPDGHWRGEMPTLRIATVRPGSKYAWRRRVTAEGATRGEVIERLWDRVSRLPASRDVLLCDEEGRVRCAVGWSGSGWSRI